MRKNVWKLFACLVFLGTGQLAYAHTGHDTSNLLSGLTHPFGLDHLLAMLAVGLWSVSNLPANKAWQGPAAFLGALLTSAMTGSHLGNIPHLESLIAGSVLLFGIMLIVPRHNIPSSSGLILIICAASLHGLAHGAEAPDSGFSTYAAGFLMTTALLHLGGILLGRAIEQHCKTKATLATRMLGAGFGGAGIYLLGQLTA